MWPWASKWARASSSQSAGIMPLEDRTAPSRTGSFQFFALSVYLNQTDSNLPVAFFSCSSHALLTSWWLASDRQTSFRCLCYQCPTEGHLTCFPACRLSSHFSSRWTIYLAPHRKAAISLKAETCSNNWAYWKNWRSLYWCSWWVAPDRSASGCIRFCSTQQWHASYVKWKTWTWQHRYRMAW